MFDASNFACQIAAQVKDFDPLNYIEKKEVKKMARFIHLAIAASEEAVKASGLKVTPENDERVGVHIGSGIGGFDIIEREHSALLEGGPRKISPFFIPSAIVNLAAGQVSMRFGAKGPNEATATACTTSAHSIGDSFRIIQHNDADVMIAGGSEAAITPMGVGGFAAMRALSTRNEEPEKASRPWDQGRDGFVIGEGAGIVILEELEHAHKRGAPILAEIVGYGMSADAYHITQPAPEHEGGFRVMRNAVRDAGVTPNVIGYVNAHGTSTPIGDALEAHAIRNFFGEHKVAVSSTKSMTGHLLGGAGGWKPRSPFWPYATRFCPRPSIWRTPILIPRVWTWFPIRPAKRKSNMPCRTRSGSAAPTARFCSAAGRNNSRTPLRYWMQSLSGRDFSDVMSFLPSARKSQ